MKRIATVTGILIMLIAIVAFAQVRDTTGRLTADTLIYTGPAVLYGVLIETNGTDNVTLILYDNTSATGKVLRKLIVPAANYYGGFELPVGLRATTGIYADVTGTGAAFWLTWGRQ